MREGVLTPWVPLSHPTLFRGTPGPGTGTFEGQGSRPKPRHEPSLSSQGASTLDQSTRPIRLSGRPVSVETPGGEGRVRQWDRGRGGRDPRQRVSGEDFVSEYRGTTTPNSWGPKTPVKTRGTQRSKKALTPVLTIRREVYSRTLNLTDPSLEPVNSRHTGIR